MLTGARNLYGKDGPLEEQLKLMEEDNFLETDFEDGLISVINEIQNLSRTKIFMAPQGPQHKKNGTLPWPSFMQRSQKQRTPSILSLLIS